MPAGEDVPRAGGPAPLARRVRPSARTALAVLLLAMAAGQLSDVGGFVRILATYLALHNCGCFGVHLGQPLQWWVLLEDAEFVALAAWVRARQPEPFLH